MSNKNSAALRPCLHSGSRVACTICHGTAAVEAARAVTAAATGPASRFAPIPQPLAFEQGFAILRVVDSHGTVAIRTARGWEDVAGYVLSGVDALALDAFAQGRARSLTVRGNASTEPRLVAVYS